MTEKQPSQPAHNESGAFMGEAPLWAGAGMPGGVLSFLSGPIAQTVGADPLPEKEPKQQELAEP